MSNNFFTFFELFEDLVQPIKEKNLATEDEIENVSARSGYRCSCLLYTSDAADE